MDPKEKAIAEARLAAEMNRVLTEASKIAPGRLRIVRLARSFAIEVRRGEEDYERLAAGATPATALVILRRGRAGE